MDQEDRDRPSRASTSRRDGRWCGCPRGLDAMKERGLPLRIQRRCGGQRAPPGADGTVQLWDLIDPDRGRRTWLALVVRRPPLPGSVSTHSHPRCLGRRLQRRDETARRAEVGIARPGGHPKTRGSQHGLKIFSSAPAASDGYAAARCAGKSGRRRFALDREDLREADPVFAAQSGHGSRKPQRNAYRLQACR
jgi:hypothetical protein